MLGQSFGHCTIYVCFSKSALLRLSKFANRQTVGAVQALLQARARSPDRVHGPGNVFVAFTRRQRSQRRAGHPWRVPTQSHRKVRRAPKRQIYVATGLGLQQRGRQRPRAALFQSSGSALAARCAALPALRAALRASETVPPQR